VKASRHEHEFEAAPGLPEALPAGERIIWQGSPDWRVLAIEALHLRKAAIYFAVLLIWRMALVMAEGQPAAEYAGSLAALTSLAVLALCILAGMAWLISRTSLYTLTDRRVVMRIGVVLGITFNLPLGRIVGADIRLRADGKGDIALQLAEPEQIAYANLWPHARPWRVKRSQPMLRAIPEVQRVGAMLAKARAALPGAVLTTPAAAPERVPALSPTAAGGRLAV
jgi:hypothetical protein